MSHKVEICTPEEAARIIARLTGRDGGIGIKLDGRVEAVCREANGDVAWKIDQTNVVTDAGRRNFFTGTWAGGGAGSSGLDTCAVIVSPNTDPGLVARYALLDDGTGTSSTIGGGAFVSSAYDSVTLTRSWTPTAFPAPAANRRVGTIGLCGMARHLSGSNMVLAYTVLNPVKTQTTTQTLEVVYRITMTPIY